MLHFTIYTRPDFDFRDAKDAAVRGYVGVFANARGKYLSTDKIVPWETEVRDTHDVIDWISRQPWSNGKVGMFGHSYDGFADGRYFNLSYYLGRASYAADRTTRSLLTPGKVASLPFSRTPLVSRQLSKGSRLLLLVSVNKNPFAQVNYGTGRDVSDESIADAGQPLKVRWYSGSFIDVPLRSDPARRPTTPARD